MKTKITVVLCLLFIALTGCKEATNEKVQSTAEFVLTNSATFDETKAAALVLKDHPDFPKPGEVKKIETITGGPAPGTKVSGEMTTTIEHSSQKDGDVVSVDLDSYVVTLTKKWNITVNGNEAKSIWKYKVTNDGKVELISKEENADIISTIK